MAPTCPEPLRVAVGADPDERHSWATPTTTAWWRPGVTQARVPVRLRARPRLPRPARAAAGRRAPSPGYSPARTSWAATLCVPSGRTAHTERQAHSPDPFHGLRPKSRDHASDLEPPVGIEPTTYSLRVPLTTVPAPPGSARPPC